MQVKVFEAEDMNAGLRMVRKELGPDALILSTKTIRNGKLGLLGKPTIEITAAIDTTWPEQETTDKPKQVADPDKQQSISCTVNEEIQLDYSEEPPPPAKVSKPVSQYNTQEKDTLRTEVDELRQMVKQLAGKVDTPQSLSADAADPHADKLRSFFSTYGIEDEAAQYLINTLNTSAGNSISENDFHRLATDLLETLINVAPPDFATITEQKRIAMIGPTGVGKTTTLAKLAALYLSGYSDSIALITIDTYRIAAVEQLKVYGEIMHLPVEVVISPEQLRDALAHHSDKQLILIDTAGRSPKDAISIMELSQFLRPDLNIEKHLVLSAATRENELSDIIERFQPVGIDRTIFTKVDECLTNGTLFSIQLKNNTPLSFITNGQRVPEDLLLPTPRIVAELILPPDEGTADDQLTEP